MTWYYQPAGHLQRRFLQCTQAATWPEICRISKRFVLALRKQYRLVLLDSQIDEETRVQRPAFLIVVHQWVRAQTRLELKHHKDVEELLGRRQLKGSSIAGFLRTAQLSMPKSDACTDASQ